MKLYISKPAYDKIMSTVGVFSPETGGVLGADSNGIVKEFYYDSTGEKSKTSYTPDTEAINRVICEQWLPKSIHMVGIVHSHSPDTTVPSCMDIAYGIEILKNLNSVNAFYLPIISKQNNELKMFCYVVYEVNKKYVCRAVDYCVI